MWYLTLIPRLPFCENANNISINYNRYHYHREKDSRKYSSNDKLDDFRIMNPRKELQESIIFLNKVSDELVNFNRRLTEYYYKKEIELTYGLNEIGCISFNLTTEPPLLGKCY